MPLIVGGKEIESVIEFPYLGSVVSSDGRVEFDISRRIAQASRAFGALRKAVFMDKDLQVTVAYPGIYVEGCCTVRARKILPPRPFLSTTPTNFKRSHPFSGVHY